MSFTDAQREAIAARGNVLVVAGAGTGKTSTLVERCLDCLINEKPAASLDQILMVTFTEAAAAEMRHRIRVRLEEELAKPGQRGRWEEQLALFETAHIGTLHGFCLQLVKQHFYELELDPQLNVLAEEEAKLLADETLEDIFQAHYAGETSNAAAVQELIQKQSRGWDLPIRTLVLKLHHYTQTLRNPKGWFDAQLRILNSAEPAQWETWLVEGVVDWRKRWQPALQEAVENLKAVECLGILKVAGAIFARGMRGHIGARGRGGRGLAEGEEEKWRKPFGAFFPEAQFLHSLARRDGERDPLAEDWEWMRGKMATLLGLAQEFTKNFSDAKRELGAVDFHDLEQHALELLVDRASDAPKATAREWREKLRFVFVDEYQDINDAQDAILKALGREDELANRFLVGDVKQSIYRFRLADPHIFQNYVDSWRGEAGRAIPLVDNFRSREAIIDFVNSVFGALMRREIGSVPYDDKARLRFGDPKNRAPLSVASDASPCVELRLRLQGGGEGEATGTEEGRAWNEIVNLEESAKEARLTALRLRELKDVGQRIWDNDIKGFRAVEWGDMAVLLRSPSGKVESYAREFTRLGVPLQVARGGFYESLEITDLLSLLQVLDNPLQDIPALAVLRSPLVGMSLDELASVRLMAPKTRVWTALQRFHEVGEAQKGWAKADRFLNYFARWRNLARQVSLSRCLAAVLDETHYAAWLLTQPRGEQRHANVQRLLKLAQQFDQFQRQGLFRFLHFIEAQQAAETEPQVAASSGENSVSLMSIHQSKGLEFPVVVVGDLGKPFNLLDLHTEIILDERYGLCPQIKPPHTGQHYPSLPYWLARQRQKQEMLGEELRVLYVAMTRARDLLILTGNLPAKRYFNQWSEAKKVTTASLLAARNYLDWIAAWASQAGSSPAMEQPDVNPGENKFWRWEIFEDLDARLLEGGAVATAVDEGETESLSAAALEDLRARLTWKYPHEAATVTAAKTSVSALRRQAEEDGDEGGAVPLMRFKFRERKSRGKTGLSASEIGTAHHKFLQFVSLAEAGSLIGLRAEARRMGLEEGLSAEEIAVLDFEALAAFWQSEMGREIRAVAEGDGGDGAPPYRAAVWRELAFTARFLPGELPVTMDAQLPEGEFVVVQGVADLAVILPKEIWLVDFKTDELTAAELPARIKEYELQLKLYAMALGRIYRRPVTRVCLHFLALGRSEMLRF